MLFEKDQTGLMKEPSKACKAKYALCISAHLIFFPLDFKFLDVFKPLAFHLNSEQ